MIRTASLFSQLLQQVPRNEFAKLVAKHNAERNAKGFTCWRQFTAMLFCQLARADSLREICNGLACCLGKLVHLGNPAQVNALLVFLPWGRCKPIPACAMLDGFVFGGDGRCVHNKIK